MKRTASRLSFKTFPLLLLLIILLSYQNSTGPADARIAPVEPRFLDKEYDSGVIVNDELNINLSYAWVQSNQTSLLSLAMYDEIYRVAPFYPFFGQRITVNEDEFYVGNVIAGFELYEDSNANNILDTLEELTYFIMLNASQQFIVTPAEQVIKGEFERSYTWKYAYMEVDGFLSPFESTTPPFTMRKTIIDSVNLSFALDITSETSELKLTVEMGTWDAYEFYLDEITYQEIRTADIDLSNYGLSILFGTTISSEIAIDFVTTDGDGGMTRTVLQTGESRIFDLGFGDDYDLGINGSAFPSYTTVADTSSLYDDQLMTWHVPQPLLDWWSNYFTSISKLPAIPPLGLAEVSFLYRICYPVWGGAPFHHDPRYKAYFTDTPPVSNGNGDPDGSNGTSGSSNPPNWPTVPGLLFFSAAAIPAVYVKRIIQKKKR